MFSLFYKIKEKRNLFFPESPVMAPVRCVNKGIVQTGLFGYCLEPFAADQKIIIKTAGNVSAEAGMAVRIRQIDRIERRGFQRGSLFG